MKKLLTCSALMLAGLSLKAQQYIPFPTANIEWNVAYYDKSCDDGPWLMTLYNFQLDGDSTISGVTYEKVTARILNGSNNNPDIVGLMREDSKKIYFRSLSGFPGSMAYQESVLFDFNLNAGEATPPGFCDGTVIQSVDSVLINGAYHRRLKLQNDYWVEGLGSMVFGFLSRFTDVPTCGNHEKKAICTKINGNVVYLNAEFTDCNATPLTAIQETPKASLFKIFPNPAMAGELHIDNIDPADGIIARVTDYTGRVLLTQSLTGKNNTLKLSQQVPFCLVILSDKNGQAIRVEKVISR